MNKYIFVLSVSLLSIQVLGATVLPILSAGQCYSDPDSKNYLASLKSGTSYYQAISKDIGPERLSKLVNTTEINYYFCRVTCQDQKAQQSSKWVLLQDNPRHFSDMNGFLCAGVDIQNVQIVGSIYGPQPVVSSYYAFNTDFPELRDWLKVSGYRLSKSEIQQRWPELSRNLNSIINSYMTTGSPVFAEAGRQLWEISSQSAEGKVMLKKYIEQLAANKWKVEMSPLSAEALVSINLKMFARYLEYGDL